jgi:hypothetical protein
MGRKKSKTSWGADTVDYEKIAATAAQAMKTLDLNRFLVVCALVSDLYCPGYNPRQSLASLSASNSSIGKRVRLRIGPTFGRCGFMVPKSLKPASFA